jgi:3',5'-nucleoside bisphosphate phosphatase
LITIKRTRSHAMCVDLHSHSTASDGVRSPREQALHLAKQGVKLAALSDHDTLLGCAEFAEAAQTVGMATVPAVEITVTFPYTTTAELHVLAYGVEAGHAELDAFLAKGVASRTQRVLDMVSELHRLLPGFEADELQAQAATGVVGRPHLARALLSQGYVRHIGEAFNRYLGEGKPAYVERVMPTYEEVMALLKPLGAWVFVAHPLKNMRLEEISRLIASGLNGIEAWHPAQNASQTRQLIELAARNRLSTSLGSDDHGNPGRAWPKPKGTLSDLRGPFAEALRMIVAGNASRLPEAP